MKADTRVSPWTSAIVGCVQTSLADADIPVVWLAEIIGNGVDASPIMVGDRGNMAWVRLVSLTPVQETTSRGTKCAVRLQATVEVGFLTCYPVPDDGSCIEPEEQAALSALVNAAMLALLKAVVCCDWADSMPTKRKPEVTLIGWTPNGPQGALIGGVWTFQFEV